MAQMSVRHHCSDTVEMIGAWTLCFQTGLSGGGKTD